MNEVHLRKEKNMFVNTTLQVPAPTLLRFLTFVQANCQDLDPAQAASEALLQWIDHKRRGETDDTEPAPGGYRWKTLYLPEGTRLHVLGKGEYGYAYVVGDHLVYQGERTSPNRFAREALGYPCNAWHTVLVTLPWDTHPVLASQIRKDPNSPAFVPTPQQIPGVVGRSPSGSFLPRRRLRLLTYPKLWPDFERRDARHDRRMGSERRAADVMWDE